MARWQLQAQVRSLGLPSFSDGLRQFGATPSEQQFPVHAVCESWSAVLCPPLLDELTESYISMRTPPRLNHSGSSELTTGFENQLLYSPIQ